MEKNFSQFNNFDKKNCLLTIESFSKTKIVDKKILSISIFVNNLSKILVDSFEFLFLFYMHVKGITKNNFFDFDLF